MNLRHSCVFILLAASLMFGVGCGSQNEGQASLSRRQRLWVNEGIRSYQYQLQVNCFCPPEVTDPVMVEVRQGATVSVSYVATGKPAESRYFEKYDTVEELFLVVDDALKRNAAEISVTYDEKLGFPTRINIDFVKQAVDDEIAFSVTEFLTLK